MEHPKVKKREEGRQFREVVWIFFFFWQLFKKLLIFDRQVTTYSHSNLLRRGRNSVFPFYKRESEDIWR